MSDSQKAATPHSVLVAQLLDPRIPKTEREHAAARELTAAIARAEAAEKDLHVCRTVIQHLRAIAHERQAERNEARAELSALRLANLETQSLLNDAQAELARLTKLRPASAWDGETYVLWWHEFDDAGWAPVAISNIQATSHWTPVFDAQVQRAGGCVNSLHSEASTSGREPAHPIPTPKETTQ